jgi:hypothetical protein
MANAAIKSSKLGPGIASTAAVASGVAIIAMAIESLPLLAIAGAVAVASGVLALRPPKEAVSDPKIETAASSHRTQ